jgi:hypothetical protein
MRVPGAYVDRPNGLFPDVGRAAVYARSVLPPIENRDPGDETSEDDA